MEQHGKNPRQNVIAIVPARYASVRLPGKLLLEIDGKPIILHTLEQAEKAANVDRVIVATDDRRIFKAVKGSGREAIMTRSDHKSGSDRVAEVAEGLPANSVIVNVQGDEPLISPRTIEKAVDSVRGDHATGMERKSGLSVEGGNATVMEGASALSIDVATTCEPIDDISDVFCPNVVKVVTDSNGFALYFSRSPIPFLRDKINDHGSLEKALADNPKLLSHFRKHTGLYVYRRDFLLQFAKMDQSALEKTEMLEQLRALENGAKIKVVEVSESSTGIDTAEDFNRVKQILERRKIIYREASAGDIPQIAKVHVESWRKSFEGIVPEEFLSNISVKKRVKAFGKAFSETSFHRMFVAETLENGIVGFADFGSPRDKNSFDCELYAIYFLPDFQRRGIGGNLFRICIDEMLTKGLKSMCLDALEISPYRNFYEKMGGKIVGRGCHRLGEVDFATVIYGWDDLQGL